jgi:hypothetical protein
MSRPTPGVQLAISETVARDLLKYAVRIFLAILALVATYLHLSTK